MNAERELIENIEQLYHQKPSTQHYRDSLAQLRCKGLSAIRTILELAQKVDSDRQVFLFNLISELGNKKAIRMLSRHVNHQEHSDEFKLLALFTIIRLGGQVDLDEFYAAIDNFELLGKYFVLTALNEANNPLFIESFIEQFYEITEYNDFSIFSEFLQLRRDPRVVPLIGSLIDRANDAMLEYMIPILQKSESHEAFHYLKEIIQRTKNPQLQQQAQSAIFDLAQHKMQQPGVEDRLQYDFNKAYVTSGDGAGSSIYIFSVKTPAGFIRLISFVGNDVQGIRDAFGLELKPGEFQDFVEKMTDELFYEITEVNAGYFLKMKNQFERLTYETENYFPIPYLAWRTLFHCSFQNTINSERPGFKKFIKDVETTTSQFIHRTHELFQYNEIKLSWQIEFDEYEDKVVEYFELDKSPDTFENIFNQKQAILKTLSEHYFTEKYLGLLKQRLLQFSYICFLKELDEKAKLAATAAFSLDLVADYNNPFLNKLLMNSLNACHQRQNYDDDAQIDDLSLLDLLDEDELDLLDDYDDIDDEDEFDYYDDEEDEDSEFWDDLEEEVEDMLDEENNELPLVDMIREVVRNEYPELAQARNAKTQLEKLEVIFNLDANNPLAKNWKDIKKSLQLNSEKILMLNWLENQFDWFIEIHVDNFDWKQLRQELEFPEYDKSRNELLGKIETVFSEGLYFQNFTQDEIDHAKRLWSDFLIFSDYAVSPRQKPQTWAAAIHYIIAKMHLKNIGIQDAAEIYAVGVASTRDRYRQIVDELELIVYEDKSDKFLKQLGRLLTLIKKNT